MRDILNMPFWSAAAAVACGSAVGVCLPLPVGHHWVLVCLKAGVAVCVVSWVAGRVPVASVLRRPRVQTFMVAASCYLMVASNWRFPGMVEQFGVIFSILLCSAILLAMLRFLIAPAIEQLNRSGSR
jgi:hypothetical protein